MKNTIYIIPALACLAMLSSCLDKFPETALSPETFYSSEIELELATNRFYSELLPNPDNSANGVLQDNDLMYHLSLSAIQKGTRQAETASWSSGTWKSLRELNYYLEHSSNCKNEQIRQRYDAVAYFFRALFYFDKVKMYGDMPWYDFVISDKDKTALYKPRDSRGFVMQKVMEDLDKAIEGLPEAWSANSTYRLNKYAALALKSRAALFEGSWRKYHDIPDENYTNAAGETITLSADYFLNLACTAAKEVIKSNKYGLYKGSTIVKNQPYRDYFVLEDAESKETILSRRYVSTDELVIRHGVQFTLKNQRYSFTRALAYHYLMADGTAFTSRSGYETTPYWEEFKDRDPRMAQTIAAPDYLAVGSDEKYAENCKDFDRSGYRPIKYFSDESHDGATTSTTDYTIFRYAEVLLNYAEAAAELHQADQNLLDESINVIRSRVGMPPLELSKISIDPFLASYCTDSHLDGPDKGLILEIRRERTVELVNEGLRLWDMLRWKEGRQLCPATNTLGKGFIGIYFPGLGEYDMNNDGIKDLCIYKGSKPSSDCENMLNVDAGKDNSLSEGDKGYLVQFHEELYEWEEKDYLYPIPTSQRQIYPVDGQSGESVLTQNPGY